MIQNPLFRDVIKTVTQKVPVCVLSSGAVLSPTMPPWGSGNSHLARSAQVLQTESQRAGGVTEMREAQR